MNNHIHVARQGPAEAMTDDRTCPICGADYRVWREVFHEFHVCYDENNHEVREAEKVEVAA